MTGASIAPQTYPRALATRPSAKFVDTFADKAIVYTLQTCLRLPETVQTYVILKSYCHESAKIYIFLQLSVIIAIKTKL